MHVKYYIKALLCLYSTLLTINCADGQSLRVGDRLPPELWSMPLQVVNHPTGKETLTLSEYKDKLIILDFWATWCSPCVKSLTKLDTLQQKFGEQLAVIPITYENADKVLPFLTKRGYRLPSIINDSTLKKHFPHRSIPHQVWVRAGEVLAVTGAEYATQDNISKMLNKEKVEMLMKEEDMEFDAGKPLLVNSNGGGAEELRYHSVISKRINTRSGGYRITNTYLKVFNSSVLELFLHAYSNEIPFMGRHKRLVLHLPDSLKYAIGHDFKLKRGSEEYRQWLDKHYYSYEVLSSVQVPREAFYAKMKNDLDFYFSMSYGLKAAIEKRDVECLVIGIADKVRFDQKQKSNKQYNEEERAFVLNGQPLRILAGRILMQNPKLAYPVVVDQAAEGNVSLRLVSDLENQEAVSAELSEYGLKIEKRVERIDMLVLSTL